MLSIVPIGTCRIHTPLRRAEAFDGIEVRRTRNYGFTHTAEEALQQLRFMRGEQDFPADVLPILYRPGSEEKLARQKFVEPDLYLIEISSAKLITFDGVAVQMNYLNRHFNEFFSDAARTKKYWELASSGTDSAKIAWLNELPAFKRLSDADQRLLSGIRLERSNLPALRGVMEQIASLTGKDKVVFTTHVNALNPDGKRIASRAVLIDAVEAHGAAIGVEVYNPTQLMLAFDQRLAMEKGGLDLTHFTDAFADHLAADWNRAFLNNTLGLSAAGAEPEALEGYSALIANGDIFEASRKLRALVRCKGATDLQERELARLDFRLGNYESVVKRLGELDQSVIVDTDDQVSLLVSLFELGEYERASQAAERLLGDEVETTEITRYAALAADRSGQSNLAKAHWQRLFYSGEHSDEAGSAIISLVSREGHDDATRREWADKVLKKNPAHPAALTLLWQLAMEADDTAAGLALLERSRNLPDDTVLAIAQACVANGWLAFGARVIAASTKTDRVASWVQERAPDWLRMGVGHLEDGDLAKAAQHIQGSWELGSRGNSAIRSRRALERQFRIATRNAYAAGEYVKVLELTHAARSSFTEYPEMDAYAGRAAYATGDYEVAVDHLVRATDDISPDMKLVQMLARAAGIVEDYGAALDAHRLIIESTDATTKQVEASCKQVASLAGRLIRHARQLTGTGNYVEAHAVLERASFVNDFQERLENEKAANLKALSKHIQALDSDDNEERFAYGKMLFNLDPQSQFGAKNAAVGAMRLHRFADAIEYLQFMRPLTPNKDQIDRNISKCKLFLKRAA